MLKRSYSRKFVKINHPLEFDVKIGRKVVIPAGTEHVWCIFRGSHLSYVHPETGVKTQYNIYRVGTNGRVVHGH